MKKLSLISISMLMLVGVFAGCTGGKSASVSDYTSFKPNTAYRYVGDGDERANQTIYIDYINDKEKLYQRRIVAGDETVGEVVSVSNSEIMLKYAAPRFTYFYDMTGADANNNSIILKAPLVKGTQWNRGKMQVILDEDKQLHVVDLNAEITGVDVDVTVPYGTFKAIEVTIKTEKTEEYKKEYYAKGIGLIKSFYHAKSDLGDAEGNYIGSEYVDITSELSSVEENGLYTKEDYFFYPDLATNKLNYELRNVTYHTGEDIKSLLQKELNNYSSANNKALIGENTKINNIELVNQDGKIKVDFDAGLNTVLDKAQAENDLTLQAIVNTVGYYFGMPRIMITIDGKEIETGLTKDDNGCFSVSAEVNIQNDEPEEAEDNGGIEVDAVDKI